MSDLLDFLSSGLPSSVNLKKNDTQLYTTPILFSTAEDDNDKVMYTFILDKKIPKNKLEFLKKLIVRNNILSYQIILATNIDIHEDMKGINKLYVNNSWDFKKYIKPFTKIICFGKSILSICKSNDLDCSLKSVEESADKKLDKNSIIEGFYDTLLTESHFNDPITKCIVWPVDSINDMFNDDGNFSNRFITSFLKEQITRAIKYDIKPFKISNIKINVVEDPNRWMLNEISKKEYNSIIAWDLETGSDEDEGGLDPWKENVNIVCFTISYYDDPYVGYYLDFEKIDTIILEKYLLHFRHNGTNLNFDYKHLIIQKKLSLKIVDKQVYDTIHLSQIYNTNQRNSLKSNAWIYTWFGGYDKDLDDYKEKHPEVKKNYSLIPRSILIPYATQDPCVSNLVHIEMTSLVKELDKQYPVTFVRDSKWSAWRFYSELRIPAQRVFTKAEIKGMPIRWEKIKIVSNYLKNKIKETEDLIRKELNIIDENFNINSNDQLGKHIENLKYDDFGRSKKNIYNVNAITLQKWSEQGHKWASLIDELHGLQTLYKTFVGTEAEGNGYYQYKKIDGKVHSTFGVGLNTTGRNNSKNPNLQNIKKHGFLALEAKDFFTPINESECSICELDGASLQLRIEASLSKDKTMKALFQNGIDIHTLTAHLLFGGHQKFEDFAEKVKSGDKKYKNWRQAAKAPNFSLCFNATSSSFAKSSLMQGAYKWSLDQCKEYITLSNLQSQRELTYKSLQGKPLYGIDDIEIYSYYLTCAEDIKEKWLNRYQGIQEFIDFKITEGRTYGACFTPFGYIRRVPLLKWANGNDENSAKIKNAENIMSNTAAQLIEWVLISKAMIELDKYIDDNNMKSIIVGNVHDSIVLILYYDEADKIINYVKKVFAEDLPEHNDVPYELSFDLGIWGFGKELEDDDLKDVEKIKHLVLEHMNKQRNGTIYMEAS